MLAIVETGGKQYQLQEGRYIDVELLDGEANSSVEFDKVVMIVAGKDSNIGQPYVEGAVAKGTVVKHDKAKKIIVYKQRCKKGYRRKYGHRQLFTRVMIDSIEFPGKKAEAKTEKAAEKKTTKKAATTKKTTTAKKASTTKKAAAEKKSEE